MRFSTGVVAAITPMAALAFLPPTALRSSSSSSSPSSIGTNNILDRFENVNENRAMTELKMAFNLKEGETSNMFDGPTPLTKERDACGVGFIANTKTGGKPYASIYICMLT